MKSLTKIVAAGFIAVAGMAVAQQAATDPTVIAWKAVMGAQGGAMKVLGGMAGGEMAFDAAAAEAAKAGLAAAAGQISTVFMTQAADPASKAKPEIWANWADFEAKAKALSDAAGALDASSLESLQAGMQAVGGACMECHKAYKAS